MYFEIAVLKPTNSGVDLYLGDEGKGTRFAGSFGRGFPMSRSMERGQGIFILNKPFSERFNVQGPRSIQSRSGLKGVGNDLRRFMSENYNITFGKIMVSGHFDSFYEFEEEPQGKIKLEQPPCKNMAEKMPEESVQPNEVDYSVGRTIIEQLKSLNPLFKGEYAIKQMVLLDNGVKLIMYSDQPYKQIEIILTPMDTYNITFRKMRGLKVTSEETVEGVYFDQMDKIIRSKIFGDRM